MAGVELLLILLLAGLGAGIWVMSARWQRTAGRRQRRDRLGAFFDQLERDRDAPPSDAPSVPARRATAAGAVAGGVATTTAAEAGGQAAELVVQQPDGLPTFADVGGMEGLRTELAETIGLPLAHADEAEAYGITYNGVLLHGPPGVGKSFLARATAGEFGLRLLHVSTGDLVSSLAGGSARNVQRAFATAAANLPCLLFFDEFDSIAHRRDEGMHPEERRTVNQLLTSLEEHRRSRGLVVVAATNDLDHLDPAVVRAGRFDRHVRVDLPDRAARAAVFTAHLDHRPAHDGVDVDDLARRSEGMTSAAIAQVVDGAALVAFREAAGTGETVDIRQEHLVAALGARGGRDRPTVEDWDWDHLVLDPAVKAELQQLQAMVEDPGLAQRYGVDPPSGVLLAGPPGTGKTSIAKVFAAQARCSFYPVSAADVTSRWAGESERSIRRLFERARANRPSIVFIDEIDALGARRGRGEAWEARQLDQLLTEMDGLGSGGGVLVVGATNRPDALDPALVRGGRLSRTITLALPGLDERRALLERFTRRMPTVGVDLDDIAARTAGASPAGLDAICQQAALRALVRAQAEGDAGDDVARPAAIHHDDFEGAVLDLGT